MYMKQRIIVDPHILGGKPVISGTRIPVDLVLEKLAHSVDLNGLLHDYPRLTKADIQAVLFYARDMVKTEDIYPVA